MKKDSSDMNQVLDEYRKSESWSIYLEKQYGVGAAFAFCVGSDLLWDYLREDLSELAAMPRGSHIGQLEFSMIRDDMPEQFLTRYDYEFLYVLKSRLQRLRMFAGAGTEMIAHSVLEELIFFLCNEQAKVYIDIQKDSLPKKLIKEYDDTWIFDLFDDMDIVTCLYSGFAMPEDSIYHFNHWMQDEFFMSKPVDYYEEKKRQEEQKDDEYESRFDIDDEELPF